MAEDSRGLFDSLTAFASTLVSIAHTRLALLSNDLEEDRARLFSLVLLYVAAMFFMIVGVVLAIILVVDVYKRQERCRPHNACAATGGIHFNTADALHCLECSFNIKCTSRTMHALNG